MSTNLKSEISNEEVIDSSELSSDSETNEISELSINNQKLGHTPKKEKFSPNVLGSPKKINIEKCPRFYSENSENIYRNSKVKHITNNLKKFAEDEIDDLNKRKFSFV